MPVNFNDTLNVQAPKPTDARSMDFGEGASIPYASTATAISDILSAYRYQFLTVWCTSAAGVVAEYWWRAGTTDVDLEPKSTESYILNANGSITMIAPYYIIGISVQPTNTLSNLQIGTTSGGNDLEPGSAVAAGTNYTLDYGSRILTNTTIYFTGLATGTLILVDKKY